MVTPRVFSDKGRLVVSPQWGAAKALIQPAAAIPTSWGQSGLTERTVSITDEYGENAEVILKDDGTLWRGGRQIGTADFQTGKYQLAETPKIKEGIAGAIQTGAGWAKWLGGQAIKTVTEGSESAMTSWGALMTGATGARPYPEGVSEAYKSQANIGRLKEYLPGGIEYESYKKWKETEPKWYAGIPSWKWLGYYIARPALKGNPVLKNLGIDPDKWEKPEGYEMAKLGLGELSEFTNPIFFIGGEVLGVSRTATEKVGNAILKKIISGKTAEQAFKEVYNAKTIGQISSQLGIDMGKAAERATGNIAVNEAAPNVNRVVKVKIDQPPEYRKKVELGKVKQEYTVVKDMRLTDLKPVDEILEDTRQLHPNLLNPNISIGRMIISWTMRPRRNWGITTKQKEEAKIFRELDEAFLERGVIAADDTAAANNVVNVQSSIVKNIGDAETVFRLKKMPVEGHPEFPAQEIVTSPHIKTRPGVRSMYLDDILDNPESYVIDKTPEGQRIRLWIEQARDAAKATGDLWRRNLPKEKLANAEDVFTVGDVFPRRVVAQYDSKTGKLLWEQNPFAGGKTGGNIPSEHPRIFKGLDSGLKARQLGYVYAADPLQPLSLRTKGVYNTISARRQMEVMKIPFKTVSQRLERMNSEIVQHVRQLDKDIKFLGGGITRSTKEGKVILSKNRGVRGLVQSIRRGEVPAPATVIAINKRFPELGAKLQEALSVTTLEVHDALEGITAAIWKRMKIDKDRFTVALKEVRESNLLKKSAAKAANEEQYTKMAEELAALQERVKAEPAAQFKDILRRMDYYHGDLADLTLAQYKKLFHTETYFPNILTEDGHHVRWEYVFDQLATEKGYADGDALREALTKVWEAQQKIKQMTRGVAAHKAAGVRTGQWRVRDVVTPTEIDETLTKLRVEDRSKVAFLRDLYITTYKQDKADRAKLLDELMDATKQEIARLKVERAEGMPAYRLAREQAVRAAAAEGRLIDLPGYLNAIIPKETPYGVSGKQIAQEFSKRLAKEKESSVLGKASTGARVLVTIEGALDASLVFIQLPVALGHDVMNWMRFRPSNSFGNGVKDFARVVWSPSYQDEFIAKNSAYLQAWAKDGLIVQKTVDYLQTDIIQDVFTRWSQVGGAAGKTGSVFRWIFGNTYDRFGKAFGAGSLSARVNLLKYAEKNFAAEGWTRRQMAEFANKITGVIDPSVLGVSARQKAIESATLFSTSYTRACLMIFRDLFRQGATAGEARKAIAGMVGTGIIGYVGLCELLGQEPKLNPAPKEYGGDGAEFMTFKVGNSNIGLPGFWYSAMRLMATVGAVAAEEPDKLLTINWRDNPILKFWMGRSSPLVRIADEILEQRTYVGQRIDSPGDWVETMGSHFMTIAAQNLITSDPNEEEGKFRRVGAEIFGLRTFPQSEWNKIKDQREEYAQKDFGKPFDNLNNEQKNALLQKYPEYARASTAASDKTVLDYGTDAQVAIWAGRKSAEGQYNTGVEQSAQALFNGSITYREYLNEEEYLRRIYKGQKSALRELESYLSPERIEEIREWQNEHQAPEDQALSRYWEIKNTPVLVNGLADWDATDDKVRLYLESLPPDTKQYILRNKSNWINDLPATARKFAELQVIGEDKIGNYYELNEKYRASYRRANPEIDAWLLLMGRVTRPQTSMAAAMAVKELQSRKLPLSIIPGLAPSQANAGLVSVQNNNQQGTLIRAK